MSSDCLAITVVYGPGCADHAVELVARFNATRAITKDTRPVLNGDLMLVDDLAELEPLMLACNVLRLADQNNAAPIFQAVAWSETE